LGTPGERFLEGFGKPFSWGKLISQKPGAKNPETFRVPSPKNF